MKPFFLSCDWGTSSFRLRCMDIATGDCLREWRDQIGVKAFAHEHRALDPQARAEAFEGFLCEAADRLLAELGAPNETVTMVLSGMTTSTIGWMDLPYAKTPFALDGTQAVTHERKGKTPEGREISFTLISGVCSDHEMMRGEETELMGLFRMPCHADLAENCVTILPGTHSKHIHIRSRKIEAIETFMSGECLEVLSQHSILSANADMEVLWKQGFQWTSEEQKKAFTDGVHRSARRGLLGNLFQTRTRGVLHQHPSSTNVWFLVGLLIGEEWVTFKEHHSGDLPVLLAAGNKFSHLYDQAARTLELTNPIHTVEPSTMEMASSLGHALFI
ncbi:MAG: 2-dehydro-3-deoxygalactonokinase [Limisphaerales bacterium]